MTDETKTMHVMLVEPGKYAEMVDIERTLAAEQAAVGGYVEFVRLEEGVTLIVNEEGKLNGMRPNRLLTDDDGEVIDIIHGPFLVCGEEWTEDGIVTTDLPQEAERKYQEQFHDIQLIDPQRQRVFVIHDETPPFQY